MFFYFQELLFLYFKSYRTLTLLQKQKYKTDINPEITSFHYFDLFFHCYLMLHPLNIKNSRRCSCLQSQNDAKTICRDCFHPFLKLHSTPLCGWKIIEPCYYFLSAFCYYKLNFYALVLIRPFSEYSWNRLCFENPCQKCRLLVGAMHLRQFYWFRLTPHY